MSSKLPVVIGADQWVEADQAGHVDVVFDDHDVSNFEIFIEATSCVSQNHRLHSQQFEDAHRQCDLENTGEKRNVGIIMLETLELFLIRLKTHLLSGVSLVQVEASLHTDTGPAFQCPKYKPPRVSMNCEEKWNFVNQAVYQKYSNKFVQA